MFEFTNHQLLNKVVKLQEELMASLKDLTAAVQRNTELTQQAANIVQLSDNGTALDSLTSQMETNNNVLSTAISKYLASHIGKI